MEGLLDRTWGTFKNNELFEKLSLKRLKKTFDKKSDVSTKKTKEYNLPLINAKAGNNGIMYYGRECDWESEELTLDVVNDGAISTGMVYAQPQRTGTLYNAYQIRLKDRIPTYRQLLFLQRCLQTNIQLKFDYYNKATWDDKVENETIDLPLKISSDLNNYSKSDIDWQFMEEFIKELEAERIQELEAYLIATNLNDYHLTDEEQILLNYKPKFKSFKLASTYVMRGKLIEVDEKGLFDIVPTKKKINANSITFDGQFPYVARGESKNGIRGYINFEEQYLNPKNTISFGQDTATMYYQPNSYFTGDKIQVFKLNEVYGSLTENIALYLISSMKKSFANFVWGQQSFALDAIAEIPIELPVDDCGNIDLKYMSQYIQSIKKATIEDVVKYKDKIITTSQNFVNE
ncbi:restriction endonuclease subunit S [Streptococcus ruminantium]|uniref:restriction endonuclease subunit S n=1 Tax=Streptococcus ruminantium TaxID=1917441 RepID=UPI0012DD5D8F|nr:restriction endonuclease subunit S [Streptococcus ruminantium]